MHALFLCTQHLCTLLKFGDQSDYITTFTRLLEIGCVSFCFFMDQETALFLQLYRQHCPKITNFLIPLQAMFFLCQI